MKDLEKVLAATLTGMTVDAFKESLDRDEEKREPVFRRHPALNDWNPRRSVANAQPHAEK
jgi:hypothetical protein